MTSPIVQVCDCFCGCKWEPTETCYKCLGDFCESCGLVHDCEDYDDEYDYDEELAEVPSWPFYIAFGASFAAVGALIGLAIYEAVS